MLCGVENTKHWQFGTRGLLYFTAFACVSAAVYRSHPTTGFLLVVVLVAITGGRLLRHDCLESLGAGMFGSIAGGSIACSGQLVFFLMWQEFLVVPDVAVYRFHWIDTAYAICLFGTLGAALGGLIGFVVWFGWGVLGIWFYCLRELARAAFSVHQLRIVLNVHGVHTRDLGDNVPKKLSSHRTP